MRNKSKYKKVAKIKKTKINNKYLWQIVDLWHNKKFILSRFKLDWISSWMVNLDVLEVVEVKYKRLIICAKT